MVEGVVLSPDSIPDWCWWHYVALSTPDYFSDSGHDIHTGTMSDPVDRLSGGW